MRSSCYGLPQIIMPGKVRSLSGEAGEVRKFIGELGYTRYPCPASATPAGSTGGVGLLVSRQFHSRARTVNGEGNPPPLVGGANWTACLLRAGHENLVQLTVYL